MQIQCILERKDGTHVTLGDTDYHFAPNTDGAHVATVENDEHIQRFLGIPEGYRIYRATTAAPSAPAGDVDGDGDVDAVDERATLIAQYETKFGKKPAANISVDTLKKKLAE